jgi:hypothetical protein
VVSETEALCDDVVHKTMGELVLAGRELDGCEKSGTE